MTYYSSIPFYQETPFTVQRVNRIWKNQVYLEGYKGCWQQSEWNEVKV